MEWVDLMECVYEQCPAKLEIDRLIEGHKRVLDKQHSIDIHHGELMNMNTKLSGKILEIGLNVEAHRKESDERHERVISAIEQLQTNLTTHTNDEMKKFEEIHSTFTTIKDSMDKIVLSNNIISWKVIAIFTTISTAVGGFATYLWGILK